MLRHLELTEKNLIHKETTRRSKSCLSKIFFSWLTFHAFSIIGLATMKENKGKNVASGNEEEEEVQVL